MLFSANFQHVRDFDCGDTRHFVSLPVSFFFFSFLFLEFSLLFMKLKNKIIIISDLRDIVHCHSIQLIRFSASRVCYQLWYK